MFTNAAADFDLPPRAALPTTPPKSIAFGSCSSQKEDLSYWSIILKQDPDLVLLLGDNVYGGDSVASLRQAYIQCAQHKAFREAYATIPILATLDDNDYVMDDDAENNNKASQEHAKSLFCDFWQIPDKDERREQRRGVYSSCIWGQELQIIMLDTRFHQSEPLRKRSDFDDNGTPRTTNNTSQPQGPFLANEDPSLSLLGETQWSWLREQFQIPVQRRLLISPIQVLAVGHSWDCWNMFPHERTRLLKLIQDAASTRASNNKSSSATLLLSGDRHFAAFYKQQPRSTIDDDDNDGDDGAEMHFVEVTSSSLTHSCPEGLLKEEDPTRVGTMIFENNFGMIRIPPESEDSHDTNMSVSIWNSQTGELCRHPYNPFPVI